MIALAARVDFGFGNPNNAGALLAMAALAVWALPQGKKWFFVKLGLCLLCAMGLAATASRGSALALAAGGMAMWWTAGRPRLGAIVWMGLIVTALVVAASGGGLWERLLSISPGDGSTGARVAVWSALPSMMRAAPWGWGFGEAANAYHNWFQTIGDERIYKHLLSTHGTLLVEGGWGFAILYVLGWFLVLVVASRQPVAFGVWICWGVAGFFNHVGWDIRLWVLPVGMLLLAGVSWGAMRTGLAGACCLGPMLIMAVTAAVADTAITREPAGVRVFHSERVFVAPSEAVFGSFPGRAIRKSGGGLVVEDAGAVSPSEMLILSGACEVNRPFPGTGRVIWLNPKGKIPEDNVRGNRAGLVVWGVLRNDAPERRWQAALADWRWQRAPGRVLFLGGDFIGLLADFDEAR